jgi:hypothetical protein
MTFSTLEKPIELMTASELSDSELFTLCRDYGEKALHWKRKFTGLLPEVDRRGLYAAHGFGSVFEFAFKLAGLSEQQVRTALNLDRRFADLPALKAVLESGEVSINKLVRVQSVVNSENEEFWAEQVKILPQKTLETLVRDERPLRAQRAPLQLSESVKGRLEELQEKGLDVSELLEQFLDRREEGLEAKKAELADAGGTRYVPVAVKRVLQEEHGNKCSIPGCSKAAVEIHHTRRFSLSKSHDPHYLAPLCREHHQLAHLADVSYREMRA